MQEARGEGDVLNLLGVNKLPKLKKAPAWEPLLL